MKLSRKVYRQEQHSAIEVDVEPELELELVDAGGGEYLVINATEWAIDDEKELDALVVEMRDMLSRAVAEGEANAN